MDNLLVYNPDKVAGTALCSLLKFRKLNPIYSDNLEEIIQKIRFINSGVLIIDGSSLSSILTAISDIQPFITSFEISIILLTPLSQNEKETQNLIQQGYLILEKPIKLQELVALIKKLNKKLRQ